MAPVESKYGSKTEIKFTMTITLNLGEQYIYPVYIAPNVVIIANMIQDVMQI